MTSRTFYLPGGGLLLGDVLSGLRRAFTCICSIIFKGFIKFFEYTVYFVHYFHLCFTHTLPIIWSSWFCLFWCIHVYTINMFMVCLMFRYVVLHMCEVVFIKSISPWVPNITNRGDLHRSGIYQSGYLLYQKDSKP